MSKLLIVGIDPGTTLGYAFLDLCGNLVKIGSSKELSLDRFTKLVYGFGKPVLVGCDKQKVPGFVQKFAQGTKAKIYSPGYDLTVFEKNEVVRGYSYGNLHEKDAVASALSAYHDITNLLSRIDDFLMKVDKKEYSDAVKEVMIKNRELNIPAALSKIMPAEKVVRKEKLIVIKKVEDKDFLDLKNKRDSLAAENRLLAEQNRKLKADLLKMSSIVSNLEQFAEKQNKFANRFADASLKRKLGLKEQNFANMLKIKKEKENKIAYLTETLNRLNKFLTRSSSEILLKRLDNLGLEEFEKKSKLLNIGKDDALLVEDCSVFSEKVLDILHKNVNIIVYKNKLSRQAKEKFCCIAANSLKIEESEYFAITDKADLEKESRKMNILEKVVEEYRKEKEK